MALPERGLPQTYFKQGILTKQGHFIKNWKSRTFVLTPNALAYYTLGSSPKLRGSIPLHQVVCALQLDNHSKEFAFTIRTTYGKHFVIVSSSQADRFSWITSINAVRWGLSSAVFASRHKGNGKSSSGSGNGDVGVGEVLQVLSDLEVSVTESALINALVRLTTYAQRGAVLPIFKRKIVNIASAKHRAAGRTSTLDMASLGLHDDEDGMQRRRSSIGRAADAVFDLIGVKNDDGSGKRQIWTAAVKREYAILMQTLRGSDGGKEEESRKPKPANTKAKKSKDFTPDSNGGFGEMFMLGHVLGKGAYSVVHLATLKKPLEVTMTKMGGGKSTDSSGKAQELERFRTGTQFAVKIIKKGGLPKEEGENLRQEVSMNMMLDHPNIVRLVAFYEDTKAFYIVTELMTGGELLDQIVAKQHYSELEARSLMRTLANAIHHCHSKGIVHRDLKPENILLQSSAEGATVKIADFGFAKRLDAQSSRSLHIGNNDAALTTACGSPSYVAPEILRGRRYGAAVDMWSLGVILYILLCGYPPFYSEKQPVLFRLIKAGNFEMKGREWDSVSDIAKDLVRKLLVTDPTRRLTIVQVLRHPWLSRASVQIPKEDLVATMKQMKKIQARKKLGKAFRKVRMVVRIRRASAVRRRNSAVSTDSENFVNGDMPYATMYD